MIFPPIFSFNLSHFRHFSGCFISLSLCLLLVLMMMMQKECRAYFGENGNLNPGFVSFCRGYMLLDGMNKKLK